MRNKGFYVPIAISIVLASTAFAAAGNEATFGVLVWMFISVGLLIVLAQLIPAMLIIAGFIKALPAQKLPLK
jgi:hypothetical protein